MIRIPRGLAKVSLTLVIMVVFLGSSLLPRFTPRAYAGPNDTAPSLPVPEDPTGQKPEQQTPEISIDVDVRDGHLTVRVVDIWGPGRAPLVVRSFTNTKITGATVSYAWQFNHFLDAVDLGNDAQGKRRWAFLEPDGTRSVYKYSYRRTSGSDCWDVYVKDIGVYSTMEMHGRYGSTCSLDGTQVIYLPKGLTRSYSNNLINQITDANGNIVTFTRTTVANKLVVSTVRDAVGRETTYSWETYSGGSQLVPRVRSVTDPYGRSASYTYDASNQLISVTNAAGRTTSYAYDSAARLTSVTNARGFATTVAWTVAGNNGRVQRVTAPDGSQTNYAYTACGSTDRICQATVTNARGFPATYDMYQGSDENYFGNVERITDALGNATQLAYDSRHNVAQATDARGNITTYTYDSRNRVTQVVRAAGTLNLKTTATWDSNDNLLSVTNPRVIPTTYTYDSKNNLTQVCKAVGTDDLSCTQYTYNSWGGVATVVDPLNHPPTTYTYTARHQIQIITPPVGGTTTFTYDAFDDQRTKTDGNGHPWSTDYDASRLVTKVTDPLGYFVSYGYDANGNRTTTTDAKGQPTTFTYDNRDRLTTIGDPLNGQTRYAYDAVSNLTQITNAKNIIATTFTYDADNRLTRVSDALTQPTTYQYDAVGNRTQMTDRKTQLTTYTYDQANRLTQVAAGGQTITYTYDPNGNRLTLVDSTGTTSYTYDNLDRLTRTTYPDGKTVQAAYDKASNRTSVTNPGGTATSATYDAVNRLTQMTQGTLTWTFGYDAAGNRTSLSHPNGTSIAYAYLINNWLASITHRAPSGTTLQSFAYTYDANGNRLTQADSSGTTTLTYDMLNRLTRAVYPGTYGTYLWTYDAVGNRLTQTAPSGTTNYTYDSNNRLTQAGSATYAYDNNGNLTSISKGQTFTWDVFNRLTQATGPGGTVTYTYNGDGLKTRRVGPNGTTNYYYDGIRPIWETNSVGAMTAQYDRDIFGNLLSRLESGNVRRYYHFDGLGSTTALTDAGGAVAATLLYDAWGNQRGATGSGQGNYRFAGTELDTTTGLYHMGARFYDPTIGRWLSEDPVQDSSFNPASLNYYAYVANNPMILTDPTGKFAILPFLSSLFSVLQMAFPAVEWLSTASTFMGFAASLESGDIGSIAAELIAQIPPEVASKTPPGVIKDWYGKASGFYQQAWKRIPAATWDAVQYFLKRGQVLPMDAVMWAVNVYGGHVYVTKAIREDLRWYKGDVWSMLAPEVRDWISKFVNWPNPPLNICLPGYC